MLRAIPKKTELQIIRQNKIGISEISFHLLGTLYLIKINTDILGFSVSCGHIATQKHEIGIAMLATRRIVNDVERGIKRFYQCGKS